MDKPEIILSAELSLMDNEEGIECWAKSTDKYCAAMVKNMEGGLNKNGLGLPTRCELIIRHGYKSEMFCTAELKVMDYSLIKRLLGP